MVVPVAAVAEGVDPQEHLETLDMVILEAAISQGKLAKVVPTQEHIL